tara:strand:+ start:10580 stop:10753 length:174 start_codon:yes stop_codon:yes gene_type:complete
MMAIIHHQHIKKQNKKTGLSRFFLTLCEYGHPRACLSFIATTAGDNFFVQQGGNDAV